MNINEAKSAVLYILKTNPHQSIMLWGAPGVGKSDAVRQVAEQTGMEVVDMRLSQMDPVDLRGVPVTKDGRTEFWPPSELPSHSKQLLFLDEANAAPRATMAAAMQLVLDRQLGQYKVPEGVPIIAAGNRVKDQAVANRMPSALVNRFIHLEIEPDMGSTVKYGLGNGWPIELIQFLRFRPNLLHSMPKQQSDNEGFPSPRSWDFVVRSKVLEVSDSKMRVHLLTGAVGQGAAIELEGFIRTFSSLPNLDQVLADPRNAPIPGETSAKYAVAGALAKKANAAHLSAIMTYLGRFPEREYMAMVMNDIVATKAELRDTAQVVGWFADNQAA